MSELAPISGLARILFWSLVDFDFIHPRYISFLFCLAWEEHERERPHKSEVALRTRDGYVNLSLFFK